MRILVIEDQHRIASSIKKGLELESYAVDIAYDGEKGHDLASTEDYDIIILDIMLPKVNGLEICTKLRSEKIHTPILILTARGRTDDKVKGLNTGADDYLSKPFAFTELLARIKALSRRPKKTLNNILNYDDITMDTINFEVKRGSKKINLSKTEYALLEFLLRHKETLVSKEQIINHVWNYDADILPNTVEVYIGYLRKKLEAQFPNKGKVIKTVRGFGYKLSKKGY